MKYIFILLLIFNLSFAQNISELQSAAEQGNSNAQNNLGNAYLNGNGVTKNFHEAVKWYKLSANQGNIDAQVNLGNMYSDGYGVRYNEEEALRWYKLAADQNDSEAQILIGKKYLYGGINILINFKEAKEYFGKACDNGNQQGCNLYKELNYVKDKANRNTEKFKIL